jgi:hypothetical protein
MKSIKLLVILVLFIALNGRGQTCPAQVYNFSDVNVCGPYGDANGNSFWDWENININDPNYCKQWYAKVPGSSFFYRLGSPFVNTSSATLQNIFQKSDYKKAKGWELLMRNFGCLQDNQFPYFILYNKQSGSCRLYIYISNPESAKRLMVTVKQTNNTRPAVTALSKEVAYAADVYQANQAGSTDDEVIIYTSEAFGINKWATADFYLGHDPNIESSQYADKSIELKVYRVLTSQIRLKINGQSTSSTNPADLDNATFVGKQSSLASDFTVASSKFEKIGKDIDEIRISAKNAAESLGSFLNTNPGNSKFLKGFADVANNLSLFFSDRSKAGQFFKSASTTSKYLGTALGLIGQILGFFSDGTNNPASIPTYTKYNFTATGDITTETLLTGIVFEVPGVSQVLPSNNTETYYKCSPGVITLKTTPTLEYLSYKRRTLMPGTYDPAYESNYLRTLQYSSYRLKSPLDISLNGSSGLEIVSAQACLVAKLSFTNNLQTTNDPFAEYANAPCTAPICGGKTFNFVTADLQAGRLQVLEFDKENIPISEGSSITTKTHYLQTPYSDVNCMASNTMNIYSYAKVFIRLKVVLKKKNDPNSGNYNFIKDFNCNYTLGDQNLIPSTIFTDVNVFPPYANYTVAPNTRFQNSNIELSGSSYTLSPTTTSEYFVNSVSEWYNNSPTLLECRANMDLTTNNKPVLISYKPKKKVVFRAGNSITLTPGFQVLENADFTATTDFGTQIICGSLVPINVFQSTGGCYNTSVVAQKKVDINELTSIASSEVYPNPSNGKFRLAKLNKRTIQEIIVKDIKGVSTKKVVFNSLLTENFIEIDLSEFPSGVYLMQLFYTDHISETKKIIIQK